MQDMKALIKLARAQGWEEPTRNKNGHVVFKSPEGKTVTGNGNHRQSDGRSHKNMLADLRRAGLEVAR